MKPIKYRCVKGKLAEKQGRKAKESKEKGVVYGIGAWRKGDIIGSTAMQQAYEMGKTI